MKLLFTFPEKLPTLNAVLVGAKSHFAKYAKQKEANTNAICYIAKATGIKIKHPIRILFVWHRKDTRNDPDNVAFAKKYILDGMVKAGMLENDGPKQILGFVDRFEYGHFDKVEVYDITGELV